MKNLVIGLALAAILNGGNASASVILRSYSEMPADRTTIFPSPSVRPAELALHGIVVERWVNGDGLDDGFWENSTPSALSFFSNVFRSSLVAPFGRSAIHGGIRLTFDNPIYAFGATEIAIDPDMPGSSSLPINVGNTRYELIAYDSAGRVIQNAFWSSYGQVLGPVEYATINGTGYMASYTGFWSNVPIHQITILGARPSDGQLVSATGSFSFSSTIPIPEPSTLVTFGGLLGMGLVAGWWKRRRKAA